MNVNDRLDRIESKVKLKSSERLVWWIRFVSPGHLDRPIRRIRHRHQEWVRLDGETEDALQLRAESEVAPQPGQAALTMLMD